MSDTGTVIDRETLMLFAQSLTDKLIDKIKDTPETEHLYNGGTFFKNNRLADSYIAAATQSKRNLAVDAVGGADIEQEVKEWLNATDMLMYKAYTNDLTSDMSIAVFAEVINEFDLPDIEELAKAFGEHEDISMFSRVASEVQYYSDARGRLADIAQSLTLELQSKIMNTPETSHLCAQGTFLEVMN